MRIFLATPFTYNLDRDFLNRLRAFISSLGHEPCVPHDYATDDIKIINEEIIGNFRYLDSCDVIIADTTIPSHGVGMEILYAYQRGKKVVLMHKNGSRISHMALFHAHNVINYDSIEDLEKKLKGILGS